MQNKGLRLMSALFVFGHFRLSKEHLWFAGFTPELVAVVWIGFDKPRGIGVPSSVGALPIWRSFLEQATGGHVRGAFLPPKEVEQIDVDPATGAVALAGCPEQRSEYFLRGTTPQHYCPEGETPRARDDGFRATRREFFDWLRTHL